MKKKYIIALEDRNVWSCGVPAKTLLLSDVSIFGTDLSSVNTGIELTPYTEPDLEQVRKEAYEDGYKTAKVQCNIQAEKDLREVGERHYQKGLSDGRRIERENIFKTLEKVSDGNVDYDKLTLGDCRIILEISKRMQKRQEGE